MINVNRGKYKYTISDFPKNSEGRKINKALTNDIKTLAEVVKKQCSELYDIIHVIPNPPEWDNRYFQQKDGNTQVYYDPIIKTFRDMEVGKKLTLRDFNQLASLNYGLWNHVFNMLGNRDYGLENNVVNKNDKSKITLNEIKAIKNNIDKTDRLLNNIWLRYFDNSGYCTVSCQVACQSTCQLACQTCQYNTCHNQNCGGWS